MCITTAREKKYHKRQNNNYENPLENVRGRVVLLYVMVNTPDRSGRHDTCKL